MICVNPIMNFKNSNLSTNKINNNRQNKFNSVPNDSVSFGNANPMTPQRVAKIYKEVVTACTCDNPVDKKALREALVYVQQITENSLRKAEERFGVRWFNNHILPEQTVLADSIKVFRNFEELPHSLNSTLVYRVNIPILSTVSPNEILKSEVSFPRNVMPSQEKGPFLTETTEMCPSMEILNSGDNILQGASITSILKDNFALIKTKYGNPRWVGL